MTRGRSFDPEEASAAFWQRDDVRPVLATRDIGRLFALYLASNPECTQTRLASLTQHDRSEVSNLIRGARSPRISDIDVLTRVADGLAMPDAARVMLGLAPRATRHPAKNVSPVPGPVRTGWYRNRQDPCARIAICGSRSAGTDGALLDESVRGLGTLLTRIPLDVDHGPVGIGIEIMTYIADHYRPRGLGSVVGVFGRSNVVRHADYVLVLGGGEGTLDEIDLAISMGKAMLPLSATGGTARWAYGRLVADESLRAHLLDEEFQALRACDVQQYVRIVEKILTMPRRSSPS